QLVWRRHPDRVDGMVLCATSRAFGTSGAGGRAMASMAGMASLIVRATPRRVQRSVGSRLLDARFDQSDLGRWARQQVIQNDTRMVLEAGQALAGFSSREWIGGVDLPVAVVLTEYDSVVPPHRQRRLAESIPGATIHPVAGDHGVCSTDPRTFVPGLLDACDSVVTRGPARRRQAG
ncbi:MAG: alpha/beta fold hydrolase, partial [Acidimicrobiales bacterium]